MHISLRAGEKIYINGAVLRADRKVCIEIMNDATFLLAAHVMKVEDATTPLRQLYFIMQIMLMSPNDTAAARDMFEKSIGNTIEASGSTALVAALRDVERLVEASRVFDAMKALRTLFPIEAEIMANVGVVLPTQAA